MQLRCIQRTLDFVQCIRDIHQLASVVHASFKASANQLISDDLNPCKSAWMQLSNDKGLKFLHCDDSEAKSRTRKSNSHQVQRSMLLNTGENIWKQYCSLLFSTYYYYQSMSVICLIRLFQLTRLQTHGAEGRLIIRVFVKEHAWYGQFVKV